MKKVAVIILTHNGEKYLADCLGSLAKTDYPADKLDIIVVDNDSSDSTVAKVRDCQSCLLAGMARAENLDLIVNKENLGFAGGNNVGIRRAMQESAEYVVLLNQDTVVDADWLKELVKAADEDKKVAAVQARLMLWPDKDKINSVGNHIHYLGFGYCDGYQQPVSDYLPTHSILNPPFEALGSPQALENKVHLPEPKTSKHSKFQKDITYASGAATLLKIDVLKKVGLLDEDLFCYHEDLDLGWRMRLAGYSIKLAPEAVVYHKYEFRRSIKKYYYMERNRFLVMLENYRWLTLLLISPALLVMEIGLFLFSLKSGWWKEKLRVYGYFLNLNNWDKIFAKRKESQSHRQVGDRKIVKYFVGKIEFQEPEMENFILKYIANPIFSLYWRVARILIWWWRI